MSNIIADDESYRELLVTYGLGAVVRILTFVPLGMLTGAVFAGMALHAPSARAVFSFSGYLLMPLLAALIFAEHLDAIAGVWEPGKPADKLNYFGGVLILLGLLGQLAGAVEDFLS